MLPSVLVDFDGTVVLEDTTDLILERFADPAWRTVETAWIEGRIGSRECLSRQIDLVRASQTELDRLAAAAPTDPALADFVAICRRHRLHPVIASDGFECIIERVLERAGVALPIVGNRMVSTGVGRWRAEFPNFHGDCSSQSGNCKCMQFKKPAIPRILIGDGRSDFCPASQATTVFAKKALAIHCRKSKIDHVEIAGFADVIRVLPAILAEQRTAAAQSGEAGLYA